MVQTTVPVEAGVAGVLLVLREDQGGDRGLDHQQLVRFCGEVEGVKELVEPDVPCQAFDAVESFLNII